jgi:hypothetical protein
MDADQRRRFADVPQFLDENKEYSGGFPEAVNVA